MQDNNVILLPLSYLGPLQLYCRYYKSGRIMIEQYDTYQKQTYRNRCDIYGANGRLSLSIPVEHVKGRRLKVKDVTIDYSTDWRKLHWKGIESAYNSSPYFEFYRDTFEPYYRNDFKFLFDFCIQLNHVILNILNYKLKPVLTQEYVFHNDLLNTSDLRELIHPKRSYENDPGFAVIKYNQVFSEVHGFIPNLSILDLIFNMGPESGRILSSCLK
jgi:hypothetical protein